MGQQEGREKFLNSKIIEIIVVLKQGHVYMALDGSAPLLSLHQVHWAAEPGAWFLEARSEDEQSALFLGASTRTLVTFKWFVKHGLLGGIS